MENLSIVIINWNNVDDTINCIESIIHSYPVVIVDNGSSLENMSRLEKSISPETVLIKNNANLGYAKASNIGIQYAISNYNASYILLLNSDITLLPETIKNMLECIQSDKNISAVQPKILKMDNHDTIDSAGQILHLYGSVRDIGINKKDELKYSTKNEVFGACAAAALYRVSALNQAGFFDEDYFCLFEDVDLSWKLRLQGYRILYEPKAIAYHKEEFQEKSKKII